MSAYLLPRTIEKIIVPPIKCQGIKTKLVPFILRNISWAGKGRWIEPFLGSGVVLFNVQPKQAIVNDINPHIIKLYQVIYTGDLLPDEVRKFLLAEGKKLSTKGEEYYYEVRERFNKEASPLDFIFLNRSCFNGVMRFNSKGEFNVPFCRNPDRFEQRYVSKIVHQISKLKEIMRDKEWEFRVGDWQAVFQDVAPSDFVYLDPPYIGRNTNYYQQWSLADAENLANKIRHLPSGFALSMWKRDEYRWNQHVHLYRDGLVERVFAHAYQVGPTPNLRHTVEEVLLIKPGYAAPLQENKTAIKPFQLSLDLTPERDRVWKRKALDTWN